MMFDLKIYREDDCGSEEGQLIATHLGVEVTMEFGHGAVIAKRKGETIAELQTSDDNPVAIEVGHIEITGNMGKDGISTSSTRQMKGQECVDYTSNGPTQSHFNAVLDGMRQLMMKAILSG